MAAGCLEAGVSGGEEPAGLLDALRGGGFGVVDVDVCIYISIWMGGLYGCMGVDMVDGRVGRSMHEPKLHQGWGGAGPYTNEPN